MWTLTPNSLWAANFGLPDDPDVVKTIAKPGCWLGDNASFFRRCVGNDAAPAPMSYDDVSQIGATPGALTTRMVGGKTSLQPSSAARSIPAKSIPMKSSA